MQLFLYLLLSRFHFNLSRVQSNPENVLFFYLSISCCIVEEQMFLLYCIPCVFIETSSLLNKFSKYSIHFYLYPDVMLLEFHLLLLRNNSWNLHWSCWFFYCVHTRINLANLTLHLILKNITKYLISKSGNIIIV